MDVHLLLADAAQESDGKLNVLGAGWSVTSAEPVIHALCLWFVLEGDEIGMEHSWELELVDGEGVAVELAPPGHGQSAVGVTGSVSAQRRGDVPDALPVTIATSVQLGPLELGSGSTYTWWLRVNGERRDEWRVRFHVTP